MLPESLPYRALRRIWLVLRAGLERLAGRDRLDAFLDALGFYRFKSRHFRSVRKLPGGGDVVCRPDDERIFNEVYRDGCYSRPRIADGDTIIDAGAHIGLFTVFAAARNPRGRIIAIEPAPLNRELLRENIRRNELSNVTVRDCALSDRSGDSLLFSAGDHALYSLRAPSPGALSTPVRVRTLDEIFAEEGLRECALLKIDVEGLELAVLKGGRRMLDATRQVILEAGKAGGLHEQVERFLGDLGFDCSTEVDTPGGVVLFASRPASGGGGVSPGARGA